MKIRLTKTQIDQLKPGSHRYEVSDTECQGLLVRVSPTGSKVYFHYYRDRRHIQHKHSLGSVTLLTLEQARDLVRRRWYEARHGTQPPATPAVVPVVAYPVLSVLVNRYVDEYLKPKSEQTGRTATLKTAKSALLGGKLDGLKSRSTGDLTKPDMVCLYDSLKQIGLPTARLVLNYLQAAWSWGTDRGLCPAVNPCEFKRESSAVRDRVLSEAEYKAIYEEVQARKVGATDYDLARLAAIETMIFVGVRIGGVVSLTKANVDRRRSKVTFVDKSSKKHPMGKKIIRELTPQLGQVLDGVPNTGSDFVFPGTRTDHLTTDVVWMIFTDIAGKVGVKDVRPHDLRRSWSTYSQYDAGVSLVETSKSLGHANTQITRQVYTSPTEQQQARVDQKVASLLESVVRTANDVAA